MSFLPAPGVRAPAKKSGSLFLASSTMNNIPKVVVVIASLIPSFHKLQPPFSLNHVPCPPAILVRSRDFTEKIPIKSKCTCRPFPLAKKPNRVAVYTTRPSSFAVLHRDFYLFIKYNIYRVEGKRERLIRASVEISICVYRRRNKKGERSE